MSTDQDYIRKGVELAEGFEWDENPELERAFVFLPAAIRWNGLGWARSTYQPALDALAAQLVRQVDALDWTDTATHKWGTYINFCNDVEANVLGSHESSDRTMNAIKAIVDSKVLEGDT